MSGAVWVYALVDPRTDAIRYVGSSRNLASRRQQHLSPHDRGARSQWIGELLSIGLQPEIRTLEETTEEQRSSRERWWIEHLRAEGETLANGNLPQRVPSVDKVARTILLTDKGRDYVAHLRQRRPDLFCAVPVQAAV